VILSELPQSEVVFDLSKIRPQWYHPLLSYNVNLSKRLTKQELEAYAYDYYLRFLPFFRDQPEGSLKPGVVIEMSSRMRWKLGQAELFSHKIKINLNYFMRDPRLLPYSLFHEMVHLWLYDCHLDPGHTKRFYRKMAEFNATGLPVDKDVHIHRRLAKEARYVYVCPGCENRWYVNVVEKSTTMYCGFCFDRDGSRHFPKACENVSA
jgi:predicted SprT family Zn-dependent metalloprotease